jgi:hypothetical protein
MSKAAELAALIGSGQAQGNKNLIINGAMTVDQRHSGSSFTVVNGNTTTGVIADRFRVNEASGAEFTAQRVSDAPVGFEYSSKITVSTADASLGSTEFHRVIQPIEGKNISNLNWGTSNAKTLTLSFYVKSSVTGQYYISVFNNAADRTLLKGYTIDSADTWEKKTITIVGDQSGTWLTTNAVGIYLMWSLGTGSTYQSSTLDAYQAGFFMAKSDQVNIAASVSSTWQLTGVQLEVGDVATAFEHEDFATTLAKCQRYFHRFQSDSTYDAFAPAYWLVTTQVYSVYEFPVTMRDEPSLAISATSDWRIHSNGGDGVLGSLIANRSTPNNMQTYSDQSSNTGTAGHAGAIRNNNTASAYIEFSAEL